ncbi:hypothetical protein AB0C52_23730 [Streptomyces sp. NPDC048717]|uniref:hypothetical protein n=1 Tax=Streptomyces sp. NPDC048717 TaxID=3154928 RepID=UPI00343BCD87
MAARKERAAVLKRTLRIKHNCALALLDHPVQEERTTLREILGTYHDVTTYKEAVAVLHREQNDPKNRVMCVRCGWTFGMICPECSKGCGCSVGCGGPPHWAYGPGADDDFDDDTDEGCEECGGGSGPYDECVCEPPSAGEDSDDDDPAEYEPVDDHCPAQEEPPDDYDEPVHRDPVAEDEPAGDAGGARSGSS